MISDNKRAYNKIKYQIKKCNIGLVYIGDCVIIVPKNKNKEYINTILCKYLTKNNYICDPSNKLWWKKVYNIKHKRKF